MKLGYELKLEQTQKLIMTPELRQAIELLQFNTIELKDFINKELEENPMLEAESQMEKEESLEEHTDIDIDWGEYFDNDSNYDYGVQVDKNPEQTNFESFISYSPTMNEELLVQLNISFKDELDKEIGRTIIKSLDDDGYLKVSIESLASQYSTSNSKVEKVLKSLQNFEPRGICARNLVECLLLQVEDVKNRELVETIIREYLNDMAYNRVDKMVRELNRTQKDVVEALDYIRTLEPRPGRLLSDPGMETRYIVPDAEIKLVDGKYIVVLNDETSPRLNLSKFYREMMTSSKDRDTKDFLSKKMNRALWVIRSIEQRKATIKKVLESIIDFQKEFFLEGDQSLKPLTMKEVAEDIEMHESTVSRISNDKYVQTPRGLFEIKYFFSSGLISVDGDVSSTSIKSIIKDLIESEDKKKPYSDQKISDILGKKGIKVSRRTVAKYRNEMSILSSSMRRGF